MYSGVVDGSGASAVMLVAPGGATAEVVGVRLERLGDGYRLTWHR